MRVALLIAAWVAVFVVVRALALDADPPRSLPSGGRSQELWAEGAAKAQEARNWAVFGKWQTNPADNYQFWRPQAPVWVYSLAGFLKLFGVSTLCHRAHSIMVSALGFAVVMLHAQKKLSGVAWGALGLFLAGNYYYILYTRVGLIEPMVNLFAAAIVYCCWRALAQPLWLLPATWSLVLAIFSKMSGLYLLPVLLVCASVALVRVRHGARRAWLVPLLHALVVLALVAAYMSSDTYRQRTIWAIGHMAYNKNEQEAVNLAQIHARDVLGRLVDFERWRHLFGLFPISASLSLLCIGRTLRVWLRERRLDWDGLNLLWLAAAFASLQLTSSTYVRFYLVLFPPVALLGARGLDLAWGWLKGLPQLRVALTSAVVVGFLWLHGSHYAAWWERKTYTVRDTNRQVLRLVGEKNAVFAGMWALWLMFDTPYQFYTVRDYFNVSKPALRRLGITHLLLRRRDLSGSKIEKYYPRQIAKKRRLKRFKVHGDSITLFELRQPLR